MESEEQQVAEQDVQSTPDEENDTSDQPQNAVSEDVDESASGAEEGAASDQDEKDEADKGESEEVSGEDFEKSETDNTNLDADITIEKTSDELRAMVQVFPHSGNGQPITVEKIHDALALKGVVFGIDEAAINKIVQEKIYYQSITVAEGEPPIDGKDAEIVYHYTKNKKIGLQEDQHGKIDFREMNNIICAEVKDLLIEKIPLKGGKAGTKVNGKKINQRKGKDVRLRAGKDVTSNVEGTRFYAEKSGQVIFRNYQLSIESVYSVGDVDASVGNIHFVGSVKVNGNITDNYEVHATESVEVSDTVSNAVIEAGGDVIIGGGALHSKIKAKGSVTCKYAQESEIEAKQDVNAAAYLKNCRIRANAKIMVPQGAIIGGSCSARKEVVARNIGSEAEVKTEIRVGLDPEMTEKFREAEQDVKRSLESFDALSKNLLLLQKLKKAGKGFDDQKVEMLKRLLFSGRDIRDKMKGVIQEMISRNQFTTYDEKSKISAYNNIFSNVVVYLNNIPFENKSKQMFCSYVLHDGEITMITFRRD